MSLIKKKKQYVNGTLVILLFLHSDIILYKFSVWLTVSVLFCRDLMQG